MPFYLHCIPPGLVYHCKLISYVCNGFLILVKQLFLPLNCVV